MDDTTAVYVSVGDDNMDYIYSFGCFVLPNLVWQVVNRAKLRGKQHAIWHVVWTYVFMLYCYLAVEVAADMGTVWDLLNNRAIMGRVYVRPFVVDEIRSHILNVIMFVPLGFLLPCIWRNCRKIQKITYTGFFMSLAIELSQLFCYRVTDINDLITNTLGTIIGYIIWIIFNNIVEISRKKFDMIRSNEAFVYIFGGMAGIFFMYSRTILR